MAKALRLDASMRAGSNVRNFAVRPQHAAQGTLAAMLEQVFGTTITGRSLTASVEHRNCQSAVQSCEDLAIIESKLPEAGGYDFVFFCKGAAMDVLSAAREVLDWADSAPALAEALVLSKLTLVEAGLNSLPLSPEVELEWARLRLFQGEEEAALVHLEKLLRYSGSIDPTLIERGLQVLRSFDAADYDTSRLPKPYKQLTLLIWQRLQRILAELPAILEDPSKERVKHRCVRFVADLLKTHQCFWLEPGDQGEWSILAYQGPPGFAFYSHNLLSQALERGELVAPPTLVDAYESVILSEARGVMVVVLEGRQAALYVSHKDFSGEYNPEEISLLRLVANIAASHFEAYDLHLTRLESDRRLKSQRQILADAYERASLGVAWLDPKGQIVEANPAFRRIHREGYPFWENLWGPDAYQAQLWYLTDGVKESRVFRCAKDGEVSWQAYYLEAAGTTQLCVVQDLTDEHGQESVLVLERERHWLASDLHDGAGQTEAVKAMLGQPNRLEEVRHLINWLRSPLHGDESPELAFQSLAPPSLTWRWVGVRSKWCPRLVVCYRLLQEVWEQELLWQGSVQWHLDQNWNSTLTGADFSAFQASAAIEERLRLFAGAVQPGSDSLTWTLS